MANTLCIGMVRESELPHLSEMNFNDHNPRLRMVLCVGCLDGGMGNAAMITSYHQWFVFFSLFLFGSKAVAGPDYWESDNGRIIPSGDPNAALADCQTIPNQGHSVWINALTLYCYTSDNGLLDIYRGKYGELPEPTYDCLAAKPVATHTKAKTACFKGCSYTTVGGWRDYNDSISLLIYEYVPTGATCDGSEEMTLPDGTEEYTETNDNHLDCRLEGTTEVCITADKSCKLINGVEVCIDNQTLEEEYNCGTFNGEVVCFKKNTYSNCQYVKGEYLCVYPEGDKIDAASADHPSNGGNANGNSADDILDPDDLINNTPEAQTVQQIVREQSVVQQAQQQAETDHPASSFSGIECDKTVSCSGDAIQCAIARLEKKQLCLSQFNDSEIQQIISSNDQMAPLGTLPGDSLDIHVHDFLETDEYVSSDQQCPEPLSYTVLGQEYEIALTPLCDLASYISWFILFASWFSMSVILAKSLGNG